MSGSTDGRLASGTGGFGGRVRPGSPRRQGKGNGGQGGGRGGIRCPGCGWVPERAHLWECTCGHNWNTFATRGRCPGCGRQWTETDCLRCFRRFPHRAWYVGG